MLKKPSTFSSTAKPKIPPVSSMGSRFHLQIPPPGVTVLEIEGWFGKAESLLALALIGEGDFLNSPLACYTSDEKRS